MEPSREGGSAKPERRLNVGLILLGFMVLSKGGKLLLALKAIKFAKPLVTLISMTISTLSYGFYYGSWYFAIGLVLMLLIHELGHVAALRMKGINASAPIFIPFLGAAVFMPPAKERVLETFVGFGGPLVGSIAALVCFGLWYLTGSTNTILLLVTYIGVVLNLFNLIPISPFDGGRVMQAAGSWFKYLGFAALLAFVVATKEIGLLLLVILVLESFDRLPLWWRPAIAWFLTLTMLVFFLLGVSAQPWWLSTIDVVLGSVFSFLYTGKDQSSQKKGEVRTLGDERPYPPLEDRIRWTLYYAVLLGVLIWAAVAIVPLLPHDVLKNADTMWD